MKLLSPVSLSVLASVLVFASSASISSAAAQTLPDAAFDDSVTRNADLPFGLYIPCGYQYDRYQNSLALIADRDNLDTASGIGNPDGLIGRSDVAVRIRICKLSGANCGIRLITALEDLAQDFYRFDDATGWYSTARIPTGDGDLHYDGLVGFTDLDLVNASRYLEYTECLRSLGK